MNKAFKSFISFVAIILLAVSCRQEEPVTIEYLEVNANNISGSWELVEWNGAALQSGTYVFLNIVRNDKTFTMYQNLDSFENVPHTVCLYFQPTLCFSAFDS